MCPPTLLLIDYGLHLLCLMDLLIQLLSIFLLFLFKIASPNSILGIEYEK